MKCSICQTEYESGRWCPNCGAPATEDLVAFRTVTQPQKQDIRNRNMRKQAAGLLKEEPKKKPWWIVIAAVLVLAAVLIILLPDVAPTSASARTGEKETTERRENSEKEKTPKQKPGSNKETGTEAAQLHEELPADNMPRTEYEYFDTGAVAKKTEYDGSGKPVRDIVYRPDGTIQRSTEYDSAGDVIKSEQYDTDGTLEYWIEYESRNTENQRNSTWYNADGTVDCRFKAEYDENGNLIKDTSYRPDGTVDYRFVYEYDSAGRLIRSLLFDENGTLNASFLNEYDSSGNMIKETHCEKDGTVYGWTTYEYDGKGNMVKATVYNEDGKVDFWYAYEYDSHGNLIKETEHIADESASGVPYQEGKEEGVMSHAEYIAAKLDSQVVISGSVQAKAYNADVKTANLYLDDGEGAYFIYGMSCTDEDDRALAIGTKIKVTGYKSEWAGEVEITDAYYEVLGKGQVYDAADVTALLGDNSALMGLQNKRVTFRGLTVEPSYGGAAFLYNWDGSGTNGSDLYFYASYRGYSYEFCVEADECGPGTEVYEAVKKLSVGDVLDIEALLYWYEGPNPHVCAIQKH